MTYLELAQRMRRLANGRQIAIILLKNQHRKGGGNRPTVEPAAKQAYHYYTTH